MVVMTIFSVVAGSLIAAFSGLGRRARLEDAARRLASFIQEAKTLSTSVNLIGTDTPKVFGIYLTTTAGSDQEAKIGWWKCNTGCTNLERGDTDSNPYRKLSLAQNDKSIRIGSSGLSLAGATSANLYIFFSTPFGRNNITSTLPTSFGLQEDPYKEWIPTAAGTICNNPNNKATITLANGSRNVNVEIACGTDNVEIVWP